MDVIKDLLRKEYDFESVAGSSVKGSITSVGSLEKMDEFVKDGWNSLKADEMKCSYCSRRY